MKNNQILSFAVVSSLLCLSLSSAAQANSFRFVKGEVIVLRGEQSLIAKPGMRLLQGDQVRSDGSGEALLKFDDGARLAVRVGSTVEFKELRLQGPASLRQQTIDIVKGSLRYISGKATVRRKVTFVTSTATIGIRGTDIEISVSEEPVQDNNPGTYLKVNTGAALLTAPDGAQVDVAPGEVAYGGETELTTRGFGGIKRASARKLQSVGSALFKASGLDAMMK